ncbi:MAG: hypothetical protein IPP77_06945 [Bacteroidetes bacterium]|nr:hypothetical protein [Bacteroidota bacterium]
MIANLRLNSNATLKILFALLVWSLLILRFGYRFGTGDQVEVLPYTLWLQDSSLYPHDFVIQALASSVPNERTAIAYLLLPFVNHLEVACLIFHCLFTVILILGLMKLAEMFIQNKYFAWLSIPAALIVFNDFALGNLELYNHCLQASLIAVAIIGWAILYFFQGKYLHFISLMSIASIMHGLEGLDVMLVLGIILLILIYQKKISLSKFFLLCGIYLGTAGIYLLALFFAKQGNTDISNTELFEILFRFRHPHHFIFLSFPKFKMVVFFLLTLFSMWYFRNRSPILFRFMLIGFIGILLYAISVDGFQNIFIANFQLYRITTWMKFFGVVAVVAWIERFVSFVSLSHLFVSFGKSFLLISITDCWIVILSFNQMLPYKVPFELFSLKENNEMISICQEIKNVTPKDALFIQPFDNSELKYYAERSSYVEFKANVHDKKYVREWYKRIQLVYGLDIEDSQKGFGLKKIADDNFALDSDRLKALKLEGVTHMLVEKGYHPPIGELIVSNNSYAVYQL